MRVSGIDMMIGVGFLLLGVCVANLVLQQRGAYSSTIALIALVLTVVFYVVGGSWLYQALSFFPMSVPKCPHCQKQGPFSRHFHRDACHGFLCVQCEGYFEVWFGRIPKEHVPSGYAELTVRFPYHFGGYTLLHAEQADRAVTVDESTSPIHGVFELEAGEWEALLMEARTLWPDFTPEEDGYVDPDGLLRMALVDHGVEIELRRSYHHGTNARHLHRFYRLGCRVLASHPSVHWRGFDGEVLELSKVIREF